MEHRSVWLATSEPTSFPALEEQTSADVVVVGGGITGLTAALLAQREGARVALVEATRIGTGTTGHTTGKVTSQHNLTYAKLVEKHGEAAARTYGEANQAALEQVARLVSELGIACEFERADAFVYTEKPEERRHIEEEAAVARRLGLPASVVERTELPFPVHTALRFENQAHFHAHRYCLGLAASFAAGGGRIFEQTRVLEIDEEEAQVTVKAASGSVVAGQAVVATLLPIEYIGAFFAKARPSRSYGLAATLRGPAPKGMYISAESPTRSIRPWQPPGGGQGVILVGDSHETGHAEDTARFYEDLERWARGSFDVEAIAYRWSAQDYNPIDELPYVGRSPGKSRVLVGTGFKKWGLTNGTAAAMMLADLIAGRKSPWLETFDATRIGDASTVAKLVKENLHVGKRWAKDQLARLSSKSVAHLGTGEAGMVEVQGRSVGAYRHPDGRVQAVSIVCTHMGCNLRWNKAETSWDCPCHGSRFSTEGQVLDGPAVEGLEAIPVDEEPSK